MAKNYDHLDRPRLLALIRKLNEQKAELAKRLQQVEAELEARPKKMVIRTARIFVRSCHEDYGGTFYQAAMVFIDPPEDDYRLEDFPSREDLGLGEEEFPVEDDDRNQVSYEEVDFTNPDWKDWEGGVACWDDFFDNELNSVDW